MGNNQKKPFQNVQLFIEVPKNIYESGQTIQGKIHLHTQTQKLPYEKLTLGFYCREAFLVKASKEKESSYETVEKFSYQSEQIVHNFTDCQLTKGQYSFPFEIKLPENMPTSFSVPGKYGAKEDDPQKVEIRYALKVQLCNSLIPSQKYGNLTKVHYLNILKPFKANSQPLNAKKTERGTSCLCFGNFTTQVSVYVDKNFVFTGDKLQINGQVDNMHGGRDLEGFSCQLFQRNIVTNEKKLFYKEKERGVLHIVKNFKVKKGNVQNFSFSYKVPDYLEHSYSIGNHSAMIYFLSFQYQFRDGCDPHRFIEIPIYIQTSTPKLEVNIDQIPSSYEWNPITQKTTILPMQNEFSYNPEYPLEAYRSQLEKNKIEMPSFQYFNKMNAGYMTKNPFGGLKNNEEQVNNDSKNSKTSKPGNDSHVNNPTGRELTGEGQQV